MQTDLDTVQMKANFLKEQLSAMMMQIQKEVPVMIPAVKKKSIQRKKSVLFLRWLANGRQKDRTWRASNLLGTKFRGASIPSVTKLA